MAPDVPTSPTSLVDAASLRAMVDFVPGVWFAISGEVAACIGDGVPWPDVVHPEDEPALRAAWLDARAVPTSFSRRVRVRQGDGAWMPSVVRVVALLASGGGVLAWIATLEDDGSASTAAADEGDALIDVLRAICDDAADAIFVKDLDGLYVYANPSCARLFGASPSAIVGSADDPWFGAEAGAALRAEDQRVIEAGEPLNRDEELVVGGNRYFFSTTKAPWVDRAGRTRGVIGIAREVGDQRREHRAIVDERDMFATMARVVPGALASFRARPDGVFEMPYASPSIVDLYGSTPDELARDPSIPRQRTHPDDRARVELALGESATNLTPFVCAYRVRHPSRGEIWVEVRSGPLREPNGAVLWHGFVLDVTERKRTEEALRVSSETLEGIAAVSPGAICSFRVGPGGAFTFPFVSAAMEEIYGVPIETLRADGGIVFDLTHPDDVERIRDGVARSAERLAPWHGEYRVRNPERGEVWVEGVSTPVRDADGGTTWHGVLVDVTARKREEATLRAERDRFAAIAATVPGALFTYREDEDGRIALPYLSPSIIDILGASAETISERPDLAFGVLDARDVDHFIENARSAWREGRPWRDEVRVHHPDRGATWVEGRASAALDASGAKAYHGVFFDVTDRKRSELALRASEERHRRLVELLGSVLESVDDAIVTIDAVGVIRSCNPATGRIFGHDHRDLVGLDVGVLMPDAVARHHDRYLLDYLREGSGRPIRRGRELVGQRRDGSTFPVEVSVTSFSLDGERHFTGVLRDITERKRLEEQFRQAHKMEAFGQLAGGVAHDFNNLLTVILAESADLLGDLRRDEPSFGPLRAIYDAGERAAGLTRQLLAFSRKTVLEPKVIDLNVAVRDAEKLLRRIIGEDVVLSTELAAGLPPVFVDPGQLGQVIMNLAVNARDAMPRGGRLAIATSAIELEGESAARRAVSPGRYVRMSVADTGVGMTEAVRAQVFQPFFTTKEVGHGTGLGLAVVHGIVTQSGGAIDLETAVDVGTRWDIFLPEARAVASAGRSAAAGRAPSRTTILVVEDDDAVRRLTVRLLTTMGHHVLAERNGADALRRLEGGTLGVELVVTDVVMPELDGGELAERLRVMHPPIKVLFVSGYTDDELVRRGLQSDGVQFLAKPFTTTSLAAAVARALAKT